MTPKIRSYGVTTLYEGRPRARSDRPGRSFKTGIARSRRSDCERKKIEKKKPLHGKLLFLVLLSGLCGGAGAAYLIQAAGRPPGSPGAFEGPGAGGRLRLPRPLRASTGWHSGPAPSPDLKGMAGQADRRPPRWPLRGKDYSLFMLDPSH